MRERFNLDGYSISILDIADPTPPPCDFKLPGMASGVSPNTYISRPQIESQVQHYWQLDHGGGPS